MKKFGEGSSKPLHEKTATLVAAAHLSYRFVEQEALKNLAQAFVELDASHGSTPASKLIVWSLTVHKDIVSKLPYIQATIRSSLHKSAELGAVPVVTGLWLENAVSCSYLDVTFLGWRNPVQKKESSPYNMQCMLPNFSYK